MVGGHAVKAATDARLLRRGCESLLGLCAGLVADGDLNDREIHFLQTWLLENSNIATTWPGEVIHARVCSVLRDGEISEEERNYLVTTLNQLVGGSFAEDGAVPDGPTSLPIDADVLVVPRGNSFCFTGNFLFGTRAVCERAALVSGGSVGSVTRSLSYLVIGELSSRDWKHASFGTKILKAIELRDAGHGVRIITEAQWVAVLNRVLDSD